MDTNQFLLKPKNAAAGMRSMVGKARGYDYFASGTGFEISASEISHCIAQTARKARWFVIRDSGITAIVMRDSARDDGIDSFQTA